jgi:hypothetical protein
MLLIFKRRRYQALEGQSFLGRFEYYGCRLAEGFRDTEFMIQRGLLPRYSGNAYQNGSDSFEHSFSRYDCHVLITGSFPLLYCSVMNSFDNCPK